MTPTKHAQSLGRLVNNLDKETQRNVIGWTKKDMWVWIGSPWVPSLGSMGVLERLDEPIKTPIEILVNRHKGMHKARGMHPKEGCVDLRDMMIDGSTCSFGRTSSVMRRDNSFGNGGSRRGATHPKDSTICIGELWSIYKSTRVNNQGRKEFVE
jgi:hypothetical protein